MSTVYSFVPIPGAQQHKRPRRRYEEIERMYKCGWNGCEKAYGTLNHLNAHVTMQSHGSKRTPEGMCPTFFHQTLLAFWSSRYLVVEPKSAENLGPRQRSKACPPHQPRYFFSLPDQADTLFSRVQRNPKGMEGQKEGGGSSAQGRRREAAPTSRAATGRRQPS